MYTSTENLYKRQTLIEILYLRHQLIVNSYLPYESLRNPRIPLLFLLLQQGLAEENGNF